MITIMKHFIVPYCSSEDGAIKGHKQYFKSHNGKPKEKTHEKKYNDKVKDQKKHYFPDPRKINSYKLSIILTLKN